MPALIIATQRTIALRCTSCGQVARENLMLLRMNAEELLTCYCSCGTRLAVVSRKKRQVTLALGACINCSRGHKFVYSLRTIVRQPLLKMWCSVRRVVVGYVGDADHVNGAVEQDPFSLENTVNNPHAKRHIKNMSAMRAVLSALQTAAVAQRLSCECGSYALGLEVFPHKAEVTCKACEGTLVAYAETDADVRAVVNADSFLISRGRLTSVDGTDPIHDHRD